MEEKGAPTTLEEIKQAQHESWMTLNNSRRSSKTAIKVSLKSSSKHVTSCLDKAVNDIKELQRDFMAQLGHNHRSPTHNTPPDDPLYSQVLEIAKKECISNVDDLKRSLLSSFDKLQTPIDIYIKDSKKNAMAILALEDNDKEQHEKTPQKEKEKEGPLLLLEPPSPPPSLLPPSIVPIIPTTTTTTTTTTAIEPPTNEATTPIHSNLSPTDVFVDSASTTPPRSFDEMRMISTPEPSPIATPHSSPSPSCTGSPQLQAGPVMTYTRHNYTRQTSSNSTTSSNNSAISRSPPSLAPQIKITTLPKTFTPQFVHVLRCLNAITLDDKSRWYSEDLSKESFWNSSKELIVYSKKIKPNQPIDLRTIVKRLALSNTKGTDPNSLITDVRNVFKNSIIANPGTPWEIEARRFLSLFNSLLKKEKMKEKWFVPPQDLEILCECPECSNLLEPLHGESSASRKRCIGSCHVCGHTGVASIYACFNCDGGELNKKRRREKRKSGRGDFVSGYGYGEERRGKSEENIMEEAFMFCVACGVRRWKEIGVLSRKTKLKAKKKSRKSGSAAPKSKSSKHRGKERKIRKKKRREDLKKRKRKEMSKSSGESSSEDMESMTSFSSRQSSLVSESSEYSLEKDMELEKAMSEGGLPAKKRRKSKGKNRKEERSARKGSIPQSLQLGNAMPHRRLETNTLIIPIACPSEKQVRIERELEEKHRINRENYCDLPPEKAGNVNNKLAMRAIQKNMDLSKAQFEINKGTSEFIKNIEINESLKESKSIVKEIRKYEPSFDFGKNWCRFCGSRWSENWLDSPWGHQKLCESVRCFFFFSLKNM